MNTSCKHNNNIDTASYIDSADGLEHESEEEIAYEMQMVKKAFPLVPEFSLENLKEKSLEHYNKTQSALKKSGNKFTNKEELTTYLKQTAINMASSNILNEVAYTENTLKGVWDKKNLALFDDGGFRATGSVYDPVNETLYVVSSPGHFI